MFINKEEFDLNNNSYFSINTNQSQTRLVRCPGHTIHFMGYGYEKFVERLWVLENWFKHKASQSINETTKQRQGQSTGFDSIKAISRAISSSVFCKSPSSVIGQHNCLTALL